jgi:hypothetical protein
MVVDQRVISNLNLWEVCELSNGLVLDLRPRVLGNTDADPGREPRQSEAAPRQGAGGCPCGRSGSPGPGVGLLALARG